jgi:hypothetical protein
MAGATEVSHNLIIATIGSFIRSLRAIWGRFMDMKKQLKAMLQEAEIYRSQGLITEARSKYEDASKFVQSIGNLKNRESLLNAIENKLKAITDTKERVEKGPNSAELSDKAQDLIKNLFSFSDNTDPETAVLEGAVALAKFGQFDRALIELKSLLKKNNIRVEAAKNILRCHMAAGSSEEAVNQYHQWCEGDLFQVKQLEAVRVYLEDAMQKRGVDANLPTMVSSKEAPSVEAVALEAPKEVESEEEFIDITSIGITFESGPRKGKMVEFDVNFQSGNMLSLIISKKEQGLIEDLQNGMELKDIQFYSPIAIFNGAGVVSSKTQIKSGPKQGDFCLDIRIVST